ncbi:TrmO family methyltransferase [Streptomyces zhihengii]
MTTVPRDTPCTNRERGWRHERGARRPHPRRAGGRGPRRGRRGRLGRRPGRDPPGRRLPRGVAGARAGALLAPGGRLRLRPDRPRRRAHRPHPAARAAGRRAGGRLRPPGPYRPNRLGVSRCRLLRVDGLDLHVTGLDALSGSPVLDIKPYMAEFAPAEDVTQPAWSTRLMSRYY